MAVFDPAAAGSAEHTAAVLVDGAAVAADA